MKKTNRTFKRFAAITSASLLAACAVAPVAFNSFAAYTPDTGSITINSSISTYDYEAYQIFKGDLSTENNVDTLSNIQWGSGVNHSADSFYTDLLALDSAFAKSFTILDEDAYNSWKADKANVTEKAYYDSLTPAERTNKISATAYTDSDTDVAKKIAEALQSYNRADTFAEVMGKYLTDAKISGKYDDVNKKYVIGDNDLEDGYYLVKNGDSNIAENDAYTAYIVKVAGVVTAIDPKVAKPTVDKQVQDETADKDLNSNDANGWGETADHAINESFNFKLIANIPDNSNMAFYEKYKLVFNDTLSSGVDYEDIVSVKVNDNAITNNDGYTVVYDKETRKLTITINDLVPILASKNDVLGKDNVEVIYSAHLNENALYDTADSTEDYLTGTTVNINKNSVYLNYSNNPNSSEEGSFDDMGKTEEDTVGVYTYKIANTKRIGSESGEILEGATFKLYSDERCANEIKLGSITKENKTVYVPLGNGGDDATVTAVNAMKSDTNGTFDIIGLDVGTYYIKEISTPAGYNLIEKPWTINITANHAENASGTGAALSGVKAENMNYTYINNKGSSLPDTGGIGTTIFYLGGGAMAAIGGVYLISKRRMKKSEE